MGGSFAAAANHHVPLVSEEQERRVGRVADEIKVAGDVMRIGAGVLVAVDRGAPHRIEDAADEDGETDEAGQRELQQPLGRHRSSSLRGDIGCTR